MNSIQTWSEIGKACNFTVSIVGQTFQGIVKQIYLFNKFCKKYLSKRGTQNGAKKMPCENIWSKIFTYCNSK